MQICGKWFATGIARYITQRKQAEVALSHANRVPPPIAHVRRLGGMLPQQSEILAKIEETQEAFA